MNDEIESIIQKHFHESPKEVIRMTTGICNEVYSVKLKDKSVIVRLNQIDRFLKGSSQNIPVFKSKGIKVPSILFEDYSRETVPYAYQIMSLVAGEDLGQVIHTLSTEQLKAIAQDVCNIIIKLSDLPTNGKFGWIDDSDSKLVTSWSEVMLTTYYGIVTRNDQTGVVGSELLKLCSDLISKYKNYFDKVSSRYVYDDLNSKNIMIKDGKFNGVVDLDQIMYGDFLEPIGRIKASWYGTKNGKIYTDTIIEYMNLNKTQKEMVTVYALLNRINWLSEIGIQFNKNTSTGINWDKVNESKKMIKLIEQELIT